MKRKSAPKTFEDLPLELQPREGEAREQVAVSHALLEENGLSLVDYLSWRRAQHPFARRRPPGRRKMLTPEEPEKLDARLEIEDRPW